MAQADPARRARLAGLRRIVEEALAHYDLEVETTRFLAEHSNVLYAIKARSGAKYIMKIMREGDHSYRAIEAATRWLERCHHHGLRHASRPLPTRTGGLVARATAGSRTVYCVIFTWVPGVNLRQTLTSPNAFKWGRLLARIHNLSGEHFQDSGEDYADLMRWDTVFYWDPEVMFDDAHAEHIGPRRRRLFQRGVARVEEALDRLYNPSDRAPSPPMLLHGDLHPDNIKVFEGELHALDFEDVMWGHPVQDIAISLWYIARHVRQRELRAAFRRGYDSARRWPEQVPGQVDAFALGRVLMFANFALQQPGADKEKALRYYEDEVRRYVTAS